MRFRSILFIALAALLLSACNFTLAADITPPPNYVAPTPMPTLGPLFPAEAADVQNGQSIYIEKCLPCHGETGLGDGAQGKQLPVTVAALGLAQVAGPASPAQWFTTVTQGNIDRYMPPFTSLTEQERWDVVSYALSMHTAPEMLKQGEQIFTSKCSSCSTAFFKDQAKMAALSENDLVQLIVKGGEGVTAFGEGLSDEELRAAAGYLRSLSFAEPAAVAAASPVPTGIVSTPEAGTPSTEPPVSDVPPSDGTPAVVGTPAVMAPTSGTVNGTVTSKGGSSLLAGQAITLRGVDHVADSGGPKETLTLEGTVAPDGTYSFSDVELLEGRLFKAGLEYKGITYETTFTSVPAGESQLTLEPITVYDTTEDYTGLSVDQLHIAFDFGTGEKLQVFEIISFTNSTDKAVLIKTDGSQIPFISLPAEAQEVGFEAGQNTAPYAATADGFALLPSETPYALIAFFSLPYNSRGTDIEQPLLLKTDSVSVFAPEGIKLKSDGLSDQGVQNISGSNFHMYSAQGLGADSKLAFSLSGKPDLTGAASQPTNNRQALIFGAGALGLALIGMGVWLYLRDRNAAAHPEEAEAEGDEFEDPESVMDAIIALDDLHRAKKIPDTAYQQRRAELKELLKKLESRG